MPAIVVNHYLSGFKYGTTRTKKCAAFHPCTVCQKCQNFNPKNQICRYCESRVRRYDEKGAYDLDPCKHIPEGEFIFDVQDAERRLGEILNLPGIHPDESYLHPEKSYDISRMLDPHRDFVDAYQRFVGKKVDITVETAKAYMNKERVKLGRIE